MSEESAAPWWRTTLKGLALLLGLLALSGLLMGFIVFVARFLDNASLPTTYSIMPATSQAVPPAEQNARTRVPMPYAPQPWPDTPSNRPAGGFAAARPAGGGGNAGPAPGPNVPVGISVDEYRAAVASGKKVYLPNPRGDCGLSGASADSSARSLETCLARQAAK